MNILMVKRFFCMGFLMVYNDADIAAIKIYG